METSTVVWIVVAVVVVLAVIALIAMLMNRNKETRRKKAGELRQRASGQETDVRSREAHAAEVEARGRKARAEADEKAAHAERLEAEAQQRRRGAEQERGKLNEQFQEADKLDPDGGKARSRKPRDPDGTPGERGGSSAV